ncbi:MAG: hypothetical protein K9G58_08900 [Bacteroidales bacterium]|nr:hypothetical protein [Bacteroidales bacterium]MCF8388401.1 hypothetical protein [Bacteroidales bacterium]MCF8398272.1 hypothetical protein [Bacteroidales bacterium]
MKKTIAITVLFLLGFKVLAGQEIISKVNYIGNQVKSIDQNMQLFDNLNLNLDAESKAIMMNEIKTRCNSFRDTLVYRKLVPPNTDRSSEALQAAFKPAVIKDPDGFTNVRSGRSEEHEIIGQIQNDEIFYCRQDGSQWWAVRAWQGGKEGLEYLHRFEGFKNMNPTQLFSGFLLQEQGCRST